MPGDDDTVLQFPILIGDIGGTNARFRHCGGRQCGAERTADRADRRFPTIDEAIQAAVLDHTSIRPRSAVLAIAGPVDGDEIALTNCPWVVEPKQMLPALGLSDIIVLNDFEAQALAVVALGEEHMEKIGGGRRNPMPAASCSVPAPGLASPAWSMRCNSWIPVPGEGGHMDIGPRTPRDLEIFPHIETYRRPHFRRADAVRPRPGQNAYRAVAKADGKPAPLHHAGRDHRRGAGGKSDPVAEEALALFVTCLGRTAGDFALVFMSRGGVFLTGGIAQKIVPALKTGNFRAAFEDKAPHREMMRAMPVYVITHPLAALCRPCRLCPKPARSASQTARAALAGTDPTLPSRPCKPLGALCRCHRQSRQAMTANKDTAQLARGRVAGPTSRQRIAALNQSPNDPSNKTTEPKTGPAKSAVIRRVLAENGRDYRWYYVLAVLCLLMVAATTAFIA